MGGRVAEWADCCSRDNGRDNGSIVLQSSESTPTPEEIVRKNWERFVREGGLTRGVPQEIDNRDDDIEFDLDVPEVDMS